MEAESAGPTSTAGDTAVPFDRLINGRYRLLAHRGSGRLGLIYEAADEQTSIAGAPRHVAVQLLDGKLIAGRRFTGEFESGVNTLQGLAHPNLVGLLDAGRDEGRFFIVLEWQDSASLRFVLDDAGRLPLEETTAVVRAVGDALRYLHAKSIVHGNVKPENVLVTFDYKVRLLDVVPPEWPAAFDGDVDPRDDVYGLACLTYEMLTGRHPFNANTPEEALRAGLEPAPIAFLAARQWRALAVGLALQRERRTPTIVQFLNELGITGDEKLRAIIDSGPTVPEAALAIEPAPDPVPTRPAPRPVAPRAPAPHTDPPHIPERAPAPVPAWRADDIPIPRRIARVERPRSRVRGKLLALLLLAVLGALAWVYQDFLREQSAAVLAAINANMADEAPRRPAPAPAPVPVPAPDETITNPEFPEVTASSDAGETTAAPLAAPSATVEIPPGELAAPRLPAENPPAVIASPPAAARTTEVAPSGPPQFSFGQPVLTISERDVAARIVIRRTGNTAGSASIAWWSDEGSALADQDFADLGRRIERFAPGETVRTVFIPLTNDTIGEPVESLNVYLGRADGRGASEPVSGMRINIIDDD